MLGFYCRLSGLFLPRFAVSLVHPNSIAPRSRAPSGSGCCWAGAGGHNAESYPTHRQTTTSDTMGKKRDNSGELKNAAGMTLCLPAGGEGALFEGNEQLREFIDSLHANNINQYIDLPEIAVMGDTSSGERRSD